jgi:aspartyl-tRNA(Asn)/glutamyl-tRNA(Gln) amidotransferase subunit B
VEAAIAYEIKRQIEVLESGGGLTQETRGWDETKLRTFSQRSKETAMDYRYFPDPDIPKIDVANHEQFSSVRLSEKMPLLPQEKREKYENLGITSSSIEVIISDKKLDVLFAETRNLVDDGASKVLQLAANYIVSDVSALLAEGKDPDQLQPAHFAELMQMLNGQEIGSRVAKDLLPELFGAAASPRTIAEERGLMQVTDTAALETLVAEIIAENEQAVAEYRAGKEAAVKFLVGQGMKKTRGTANPKLLEDMLLAKLSA